jgi:AcrR family transcriptional regulator
MLTCRGYGVVVTNQGDTKSARRAARPTREEQRARTRVELMKSGARLFAAHGFEGAAIDAIAEGAGFSRGAFYSNFADKDELFLALLKRHLDADLDGIASMLARADGFDTLVAEVAGRYEQLAGRADWCLLAAEFQLYASRHGRRAGEFAALNQAYGVALASALEEAAGKLGLSLAMPSAELATTLVALSHGLALRRAADPLIPREATGRALELLLRAAVRPAALG